jgi:hypothetical protein
MVRYLILLSEARGSSCDLTVPLTEVNDAPAIAIAALAHDLAGKVAVRAGLPMTLLHVSTRATLTSDGLQHLARRTTALA